MFCKPRPSHCARPHKQVLPTQTQVMPAKVAPTQTNIVEKTCEYIVPEVYPSHTHNVTNHVYKHVKSFPHTTSFDQNIFHQQFVEPRPGFGPQVAGAATGPMGGPGFGPGFGGPQVAGAATGPMGGPGYGPQVMGAMAPGYGPKKGKGCGCMR